MESSPRLSTARPAPGCLVCWSRKVKCDREAPSCRNCQRLGVQCPGYNRAPERGSRKQVEGHVDKMFKAAGIQKRKNGACRPCQLTKSRCTREHPTCQRCQRKDLQCHYSAFPRTANSLASSQSSPNGHVRTGRVGGPVRAGSPLSNGDNEGQNGDTEWLFSSSLPESLTLLKSLVDCYFHRIHNLRSLGFIHQPTFMYALDRGDVFRDFSEPLVSIICALGAVFFPRVKSTSKDSSTTVPNRPGQLWAQRAQSLALGNLGNPSIHDIMTLVLVCEYCSLTGDHAAVFTVAGCCYRLIRLLKLDLETSHDKTEKDAPSGTELVEQESRRRLLWACYILDTAVGSGVDANIHWRDAPHQVPLPRPDSQFMNLEPSPNMHLARDGSFANPKGVVPGLQALAVRLSYIRTDILRLIRRDNLGVEPWSRGSPYLELLEKLDLMHTTLTKHYPLSELNNYIHKEQHILGATHYLYFTLHSAVSDLTRVALAGFTFPLASVFARAPADFKAQCQYRCFYHANEVTKLVKNGMQCGEEAFDDPFCVVSVFESTKIQIIYATTVCTNDSQVRSQAEENIKTNMNLLHSRPWPQDEPNPFLLGLLPLLKRFGFHEIAAEWERITPSQPTSKDAAELTGSAKFDYLSRVTTFRLARSSIKSHGGPDDENLSYNDTPPSSARQNVPPAVEAPDSQRQEQQSHGYQAPCPQQPQQPQSQHATERAQPRSFSVPPFNTSTNTNPERQQTTPLLPPSYGLVGAQQASHIHVSSVPPPGPSSENQLSNFNPINQGLVQGVAPTSGMDYTRLAGEMAELITWDASNLPVWYDFGGY